MAWLEALKAQDIGIVIAGNHFAATQTMDEEHRQSVNFFGAFGANGAVAKSVRRADESTVSFSAILLVPGQQAGMDDESILLNLGSFQVACKRGPNHYVYNDCAWTTVRVSSTLESVTLSADISVPGWTPPT